MDEIQKQYELVFILPPQFEEENLNNAKKEIEEIIAKFNAKIEFKQAEKKDLAYPINKQGQGIFLISIVSISPDNVNNLSKELKLNKNILRHLISRMPIIKPETKKPKVKIKKQKVERKPSFTKATEGKTNLKEIDKKLDEIIKEI